MGGVTGRIAAMDVWHAALPVESRRDHGIGTVTGTCEVVVLRLTTDEGVAGWGEAAAWAPFTGSPEACFAALDRYMRPHVLGRSLAEWEAIHAEASRAVRFCSEAKAALEAALLDLRGRIEGCPVWALLGAKRAREVALSCSLANPEFEADKALLRRLEADGVGIVKLKAGFAGHDFDVMRLRYLREAHPGMRVRVDYNQALSRDAALRDVPDLAARFTPEFIEQPVSAEDWATMRDLRGAVDVPLLADEAVFGPEDMARAVREGICDGVSVKVMKAGGLRRAAEVARIAGEAGLLAYGGDMFETGLGHLMGAHMIAAAPQITLGCEFYQARWYLCRDLLDTPFPVENGMVRLGDAPGLGAGVDLDFLDETAVAHGGGVSG